MSEYYKGTKGKPFHTSCGGVVYRKRNNQLEILLLHRIKSKKWKYDSWHLPKGTRGKDESERETAKREILEETGYEVDVGWKIGHIGSTFQREGVTIQKATHYYACKPIKDTGRGPAEHDESRWIPAKMTIDLLSQFNIFEKEDEVVRKFLQNFQE